MAQKHLHENCELKLYCFVSAHCPYSRVAVKSL